MAKPNNTITTGSNTSTENANKERSQARKETPEVPSESQPSEESEAPENANTDQLSEREPFPIIEGIKIKTQLRPEFIASIRVNAPKALQHNGLKALQEFITGTKGQIDDALMSEVKEAHALVKKLGKEEAQAHLDTAGHAHVSKNVRTFNDIDRTGVRSVRIDLRTDIDYQS